MVWAIDGKRLNWVCRNGYLYLETTASIATLLFAAFFMKPAKFFYSIRARLLLVSILLLLIPLLGFRFIKQMESYLREGQQQVLVSAARLLSATLSDRPQLLQRDAPGESAEDAERRRLVGLFGSTTPETAANLGTAYLPSEDIERILNVVSKNASRIWVVDTHSRVRGLTGNLNTIDGSAKKIDFFQQVFQSIVRPLIHLLGADNAPVIDEDTAQTQQAVMAQVDRALSGEPTWLWRFLKDSRTVVLSAAQPIWLGDEIVGAVVVEETTRGNQALAAAALESLLAMSFIVFFAGFITLVLFAWRLAYRVQRLQSEAGLAIDSQGRITGAISGSQSRDEVGTLARTLEEVLQRLARYNSYLEKMAARLAHELRTPVAVVRSSLDNLRLARTPIDAAVYIERADDGVKRLSLLIARMSEASQLESMLHGSEKEGFDLVMVASGCVDGYRHAYPVNQFIFKTSEASILMLGLPDTIAQLLDKLVQNAVDFSPTKSAIVIATTRTTSTACIRVENTGPLLSPETLSTLFNSMVSARADGVNGGTHLGLGLYIVRLIAEFHGGTASAKNLPDQSGVRFEVQLLIA